MAAGGLAGLRLRPRGAEGHVAVQPGGGGVPSASHEPLLCLRAHRLGTATAFVLAFTKTDRIKPAKVQANIAAFQERFSERCGNLPEIFTCSATTREGREELLGVIEEAMAADQGEAQAEPEAPSQDAGLPAEDLPGTGWRIGALANHGKRPNPARPW